MDRLRQVNVRGTAIQIAEDLIGYPLMTVPDVESRYEVSYQTANQAVGRLVEHEVLVQVSEGNYNRVFANLAVLDVFR